MLGSSPEIKFHGPEEAKRRVKKEVNQVDRIKKIVKDVNSKSRLIEGNQGPEVYRKRK